MSTALTSEVRWWITRTAFGELRDSVDHLREVHRQARATRKPFDRLISSAFWNVTLDMVHPASKLYQAVCMYAAVNLPVMISI